MCDTVIDSFRRAQYPSARESVGIEFRALDSASSLSAMGLFGLELSVFQSGRVGTSSTCNSKQREISCHFALDAFYLVGE